MSCITLLSDFGLHDASVAIAKGILLQHNTSLPIFDVSHEVLPFNTRQAAYLLGAAYKNFPGGTCHLILANLFSEIPCRLILTQYEDWYFLSSDNGIVPLAIGNEPDHTWLVRYLEETGTFHDWMHAAGRIISELQANKPGALNLPGYLPKNAAHSDQQVPAGNIINCNVIHIDNYENVIINFTRKQLEAAGEGKQFRIEFGGIEEITGINENYSDVRPGYKLCRFNSAGYLEICINRGKAASLFGLRPGGKQNNIKIIFE
jgi:S-adenosyl-L-methionine hydrolase (adenosine-forming)